MTQDDKLPKPSRKGLMKKDGTPFASSTGKLNPNVNQENWRTKLQARRIKFDDDQKEIFLKQLLKHGQKVLAAKAADVTYNTALNHIKNDPDFAELVEACLEERGKLIVESLEKQAMEGYTQPCFDKFGEHVGEKQMYETQLRALVLKRFDKEYTDRKEIEHKGGGGVLVVPGKQTPAEWAESAKKVREKMEKDGHIGQVHEG